MMEASENHASTVFWVSITLPSSVRYWDDISLEYRSIRDLAKSDIWPVTINGRGKKIDFTKVDKIYRTLCKRWVVDLFAEVSPTTALIYFEGVMALGASKVEKLIQHLAEKHPNAFRYYWLTELYPCLSVAAVSSVRSLCRTFCRHGYGQWAPEHFDFVSKLKGYPVDKYAAVRRGDCFVDLHDQSRIVQYLDSLAAHVAESGKPTDTETLRSAIILALSYQHGLRAGQIARIKTSGVIFFPTGAVHFKFPVMKQRTENSAQERLRAVRREWCPIFIDFGNRSSRSNAFYFLDCLPDQVGQLFNDLLDTVTKGKWTLTDLRHTAVQRLADSGASHHAITEFMAHSDVATALVYIQASPTQAARINKALALSETYSAVADIARRGVMTPDELAKTDEEHFISGMPHGIPMAGIGACKSKVGLCARNPIVSCYTCHKFLAVSDVAVHEQVAENLRNVVLSFSKMARSGEPSPAMTQLRTTLETVQTLVDALQEGISQ